jgi:hypothetical protein
MGALGNINVFNLNIFHNSQEIPVAEIVEFECFSFQNVSEINSISGCLKTFNCNDNHGGLVFLFKAKKNLKLLNKKFDHDFL